MIGYAILVGYVVGYFFALPRIYVMLDRLDAEDFPRTHDDESSRWTTALFATLAAFFWPLLLLVAWVKRQAERAQQERRP